MATVTIQPTTTDKRIANAIASYTTPNLETAAQFLTWGADEKVLLIRPIVLGSWQGRSTGEARWNMSSPS